MLELSQTPGWNYALSYCISVLLYIHLNPRRMKGIRFVLTALLFSSFIVYFMNRTDGLPQALFLPCQCVIIGMMLTFMYVCNDMTVKQVIYFCARAFILGEFATSLEWQLYYYGMTHLHLPLSYFLRLLFLVIIHMVVFGLMFLLESSYMKKAEPMVVEVGIYDVIWVVNISIAIFCISNLSYLFETGPFSTQFTAELFIIRTVVDFAGVVLLFSYHMLLQESQMRRYMDALENTLKMQYNNYQISQESIAMVNQKYHDLKHQIAFLRTEITAKEKIEYLNQIEQEIKAYETQNKTGNPVLDIVLTAKSILCQNHKITLTSVIEGEALGFMHAMDISSLFGNALDNAIESVKKIENPQKRLIHLSVARQKNFLRIRIENCFEGNLIFEKGLPITTKQDKRIHGYGLKSMQNTVKKYHGSMKVHIDQGWFELRIMIPVE